MLQLFVYFCNMVERILGVDPGTNFLGYAVLQVENKKLSLITMSILTLTHIDDPQEKLKRIYEKMQWVINTFSPQAMAIEEPFFAKNVQSMLKLGRAQGVAIAAGMMNDLTVTTYLPKRVKKSVTGNGNATKEQVAAMCGRILNQPIEPTFLDASDALAVAVCHHYSQSNPLAGMSKGASWEKFLSANEKRILK